MEITLNTTQGRLDTIEGKVTELEDGTNTNDDLI